MLIVSRPNRLSPPYPTYNPLIDAKCEEVYPAASAERSLQRPRRGMQRFRLSPHQLMRPLLPLAAHLRLPGCRNRREVFFPQRGLHNPMPTASGPRKLRSAEGGRSPIAASTPAGRAEESDSGCV